MKITQFVLNVIAGARQLNRDIYRPFYAKWHSPETLMDDTKICFVCLGGAWVAQQEKAYSTEPYYPNNIDQKKKIDVTRDQMLALEYIRRNNWREAARTLGARVPARDDLTGKRSDHAGFVNWEQFDKFLEDVEAQALHLKSKGY